MTNQRERERERERDSTITFCAIFIQLRFILHNPSLDQMQKGNKRRKEGRKEGKKEGRKERRKEGRKENKCIVMKVDNHRQT